MDISKRKTNLDIGELANKKLNDHEITALLFNLTDCIYTFASSSDMRWGKDGKVKHMDKSHPDGFYQLMPDSLDDGFFDWYCYNREDQQFFETKENATLHFIYYWMKWNNAGKPKPF